MDRGCCSLVDVLGMLLYFFADASTRWLPVVFVLIVIWFDLICLFIVGIVGVVVIVVDVDDDDVVSCICVSALACKV